MGESQWTLETLLLHISSILAERDRRYEQRFEAQEKAVTLALDRVDKEFHEHLRQVREENRLALSAQQMAVAKQEQSTEKRFENVNEFRGQLAELITRTEVDRSISELSRRMEDLTKAHSDKIDAIAKSMDSKLQVINERIAGIDAVTR